MLWVIFFRAVTKDLWYLILANLKKKLNFMYVVQLNHSSPTEKSRIGGFIHLVIVQDQQ